MTKSAAPDSTPDRHRLTRRALILFLPLFLLLTVVNAVLLVSGAQQEHVQIEQTILNSLRLLKDASVVVEDSFVPELDEGLQLFLAEYKAVDGDIDQIDLPDLQRRLGNKVDLYAIDASGVVRHSTLTEDIGLDFRQWPDFHAYLEDIRQSGVLHIDAISKETKTGLFRKYAYLPTPDKSWILELGVKSQIIAQRLAPFDPVMVARRLVADHPHLNQLRIIDRHGWQLSMTQPILVEPEVFERVKQVLDTRQAQNILGWNRKLTYLPLPDSANEVSFGLRMQVVELDCNLSRVKFGLGINLLVALAAITLVLLLSRRMKRVEEKLRESESKLSALFSSMTEMVVLHDLVCNGEGKPVNYRITDCNAAYTKITGIPREKAVGRLATEAYNSDEPPYLKEYSGVALSGEPHRYETYYPPMNKHFSISVVSPEKNRFATVTTDITELKLTQEAIKAARSQLQATLNALPDLLFEVDSEGRIFSYHSPRSDLLAAPPEAFLDKRFADVLPQDAADACQHAIDEAAHNGFSYGETYRLALPQGVHWFELSVAPLHVDGRSDPHFIMISRDITTRKRAEEALQQKKQEMEQLVYSVSHDLKSPLVTVKSFAGMLQQDIQNGNQQQITEDLKYIDSSTDRMQQLLDALLQYSRIGTVDVPAQTQPADQQVRNCLATLAGILQQHQVRISTGDLPHQLHGNPLHFGQVWQNLIENAVKYRGDHPQPQIEIGATQQEQDVIFYVRDDGMGIAPEHNERIFNLFSQLNPDSDGSGLGLALVKKIVTIYQGRIWVESEGAGRGSCFYFTLPGALVKDNTTT